MSDLERYNHMLQSLNRSEEIKKIEAHYTICNKMPASETPINEPSANETSANETVSSNTILDYLYEEGKCGKICEEGKLFNIS